MEVTKPPPGDINLYFWDFKCCIPNNILCAVDDVTCFLLLPEFLNPRHRVIAASAAGFSLVVSSAW